MFLGDVVRVPLTQGYFALIDAADAAEVMRHKWTADVRRQRDGAIAVYGYRREFAGGKSRKVYLHRQISGVESGGLADHENGDTLDCRRSNLRHADYGKNGANRRNRGARSRFKGVSPAPKAGRWQARIGGPTRYLGTFDSDEEAAIRYDIAATSEYGQFARTNFPYEGPGASQCC